MLHKATLTLITTKSHTDPKIGGRREHRWGESTSRAAEGWHPRGAFSSWLPVVLSPPPPPPTCLQTIVKILFILRISCLWEVSRNSNLSKLSHSPKVQGNVKYFRSGYILKKKKWSVKTWSVAMCHFLNLNVGVFKLMNTTIEFKLHHAWYLIHKLLLWWTWVNSIIKYLGVSLTMWFFV